MQSNQQFRNLTFAHHLARGHGRAGDSNRVCVWHASGYVPDHGAGPNRYVYLSTYHACGIPVHRITCTLPTGLVT